jgi:2-polyprenyl-3-methyl-5-hydroxy-6-metoxy-1,4-benzoquinol methylase
LNREEVWTRYSTDYFNNEYLPGYGVTAEGYDSAGFAMRYQPLVQEMIQRLGRPGRMLEIGAGAGLFMKEAQNAGWQCVGTEIMDAAMEFAQRRLGLDVRKQSAEELSFPEASFDAVAMLEVIEHLWEPRRALTAAHAVLRPSGLLVLTTPNYDALSRLILGTEWAVISPREHLYYFTTKTLDRLLAETGFDRIEHLVPQPGYGPIQTVNPSHSWSPRSRRTQLYSWLCGKLARPTYRLIQRLGRADSLVLVARRA